jgi:two-component system, OmpR family, copper resistance phosphate regulon response regulator CusR
LKSKVLLIEDEPKVVRFIKQGLEENSFEVDIAYDGFVGENLALKNDYSVILLDINIPYKNGIEICKTVRQRKPGQPILILSALGYVDDKISGFDAGADDYLVKPFEFKELVARINVLIKRASGQFMSKNVLRVADIELDLNEKIARRGGKTITLTAKEYGLLEYLMLNKGKVLSRAEIAMRVWDYNFDTGTNIVDVYINILRKKIDKDFALKLIHTKIGLGYIFQSEYED